MTTFKEGERLMIWCMSISILRTPHPSYSYIYISLILTALFFSIIAGPIIAVVVGFLYYRIKWLISREKDTPNILLEKLLPENKFYLLLVLSITSIFIFFVCLGLIEMTN